jgi:hypothetical protein
VATALGVVALHLLSTQRPPARPLPTARFVPSSDLRAVSRTSRPTDLLLLALRVLAVLLIAAAFAQPIPDAPGPSLRRVVALEWTTAIADVEAARARAQALLGEGDALVVFDTAARVVPATELATLAPPTVRGVALSPMLVAVRDAATTIARGADSLAVTVFSGFPAEAWDDATSVLRAEWPGRVDIERLVAAVDTTAPLVDVLPADAEDPVHAAVATLDRLARGSATAPAPRIRIRREAAPADDSLWLARTPGGVLLRWPRERDAILQADGVLATLGAEAALVAPLARRPLSSGDGSAASVGRVIARWRDGEPAAFERTAGQGCAREIGIGVPERGDVTLREPFLQVLDALLEPCGGRRTAAPADSLLAEFAGAGPLTVAARFERERNASPLTPWLLVAALALLVVEQFARRAAPAAEAR